MMGNDLDSDGEGQDSRGGKGRDGDKGDKKGIINRVNREPLFSMVKAALTTYRSMCEPFEGSLLTRLIIRIIAGE
jgi:hypothetical protein